jgi:aminoglycoside phosphotransferase (APT) family kinase protein
MSGSTVLDAPSAVRLAGLDPALRLLPQALPSSWTSSPWELHDLVWRPGEGCRLVVRLRPPERPPTFVAVDVAADAWWRRSYRDDVALPGVSRAADPDHVAGLLEPSLDGPVLACLVDPVRYRAGSRCVLRYRVRTRAGCVSFYAKVFAPERFSQVADVQQALSGAGEGPSLVPPLVALWPQLHTTVGEAVHGPAVAAVLAEPTAPVAGRLRLAHDLGGRLAEFHGQDAVTAPGWSAADQLAALVAMLPAARICDPGTADRVAGLLDLLAAGAPDTSTEVLAHGAFRAGQVIRSEDGRLVFLDTDGVRRCDQGRDLGNALAHLRWQTVRLPGQRAVLRRAEQALLAGYVERRPVADPTVLTWWRAAGLLQVALRRYHRLEVAQWGQLPELVAAAAGLLTGPGARPAPSAATDLLDVDQMTRVLRPVLAGQAAGPQPVEVESAAELAAARGGRRVVRYSVRGLDGAETSSLVGKGFVEQRRARLLYDHLDRLNAGPFGTGRLRVPAQVALLPAMGLVLYRHCDGTPLHRVTTPAGLADGARLAARWLARLHGSDVRLSRGFSVAQEEKTTREWAAVIGSRHPCLAEQAHALADGWSAGVRAAGVVPAVPIHKDFHPGHVLVGDDVYVIDLDEARRGDPTFDVAHFCSYLELLSDDSSGPAARTAFLQEYVAATGWTDPGSYRSFCAYTWLKIAKQCAVGSGPHRTVPTERRGHVVRALARGARWLDG